MSGSAEATGGLDDWRLRHLWPSVLAFRDDRGRPRGTGFFISQRLVLTAGHVLKNHQVGAVVVAHRDERPLLLTIVEVLTDLDVAVLRAEVEHSAWLGVHLSPSIGEGIAGIGHSHKYPECDSFTGEIEGPVGHGGVQWLKFKGGEVTEGFSGAPLLNRDHGWTACGVVKTSRDTRDERGGRAAPLASVAQASPMVAAELRRLQLEGAESLVAVPTGETDVSRAIADDVLAQRMVLVIGDSIDPDRTRDRAHCEALARRVLAAGASKDEARRQLLAHLLRGPATPPDVYRRLARMPFRAIVSLHPDGACEKAFERHRGIVVDADLAVRDLSAEAGELFLLGGSVIFGRGLLIDQEDRDALRERYVHLGRGMRDRLAMSSILFLACDFSSWATIRVLSDVLDHRTSLDGRLYVCTPDMSWSSPAVPEAELVVGEPEAVVAAIEERIADRSPLSFEPVAPALAGCSGFRYLDYYEAEDAGIFYGRTGEVQDLAMAVRSAPRRITVLCGRSGSGKTSLVRAGLVPELERTGMGPVHHVQAGPDPLGRVEDLLRTIAGLPGDAPVDDAIRPAVTGGAPHLIVIDQLEEGFVRAGPAVMSELLRLIRRLVAQDFPARFLLVIREDFLAEITAVRHETGLTLDEVMRLKDLSRTDATAVVQHTAAAMGWTCEPGFVDAVLDDLSPDRIHPAHLQVVCHRVQVGADVEGRLDLVTYVRLGRAKLILREHVGAVLGDTEGLDPSQVKAVLSAMVTGSGTKSLLSADDIAGRARCAPSVTRHILHHLIHQCRLVREVPASTTSYELAHESLVESISGWLSATDASRKLVRDVVDQEVAASRRSRAHLIPDDRLALIEDFFDDLALDNEAIGLVAASYCVRGALPPVVEEALVGRPDEFLLKHLLVHPALAEVGQLAAVMRSPVAELLPMFSARDLPDELAGPAIALLDSGEPDLVLALLAVMALSDAEAKHLITRLPLLHGVTVDDVAKTAALPTLRQLVRLAGTTGHGSPSAMRFWLELALRLIDGDDDTTPGRARATMSAFFAGEAQNLRRGSAVRAVRAFFSEEDRPRAHMAVGAILPIVARRRPQPGTPVTVDDRLVTFLEQALADIAPERGVWVLASVLVGLGIPGRPPRGAEAIGHALRARIADLADSDPDASLDPAAVDPLLQAIAWACPLPEAEYERHLVAQALWLPRPGHVDVDVDVDGLVYRFLGKGQRELLPVIQPFGTTDLVDENDENDDLDSIPGPTYEDLRLLEEQLAADDQLASWSTAADPERRRWVLDGHQASAGYEEVSWEGLEGP